MSDWRGPCPRCGKLQYARRCDECGALTGLGTRVRPPRVSASPDPRPCEVTGERYVVRECGGYAMRYPFNKPGTGALPGIEVVVLDTACNHRRMASFTSEDTGRRNGRAAMFRAARKAAARRCDELNASAAA